MVSLETRALPSDKCLLKKLLRKNNRNSFGQLAIPPNVTYPASNTYQYPIHQFQNLQGEFSIFISYFLIVFNEIIISVARTPYYPNDPYSNQIPHLPIDAQTPQIYVIPHSG